MTDSLGNLANFSTAASSVKSSTQNSETFLSSSLIKYKNFPVQADLMVYVLENLHPSSAIFIRSSPASDSNLPSSPSSGASNLSNSANFSSNFSRVSSPSSNLSNLSPITSLHPSSLSPPSTPSVSPGYAQPIASSSSMVPTKLSGGKKESSINEQGGATGVHIAVANFLGLISMVFKFSSSGYLATSSAGSAKSYNYLIPK